MSTDAHRCPPFLSPSLRRSGASAPRRQARRGAGKGLAPFPFRRPWGNQCHDRRRPTVRRQKARRRRGGRARDRPPHRPPCRARPDRRFRIAGDAADRQAGARVRRLFGNPPLSPRRRRIPLRLPAPGGDPVGRPGVGPWGRDPARNRRPLGPRRAGAGHLLRRDDHGPAVGRPSDAVRQPGVRAHADRHHRRLQTVRRRLENRRDAPGVDEPRRPDRRHPRRFSSGRQDRHGAVRRHRRRGTPLLRRPVPPRGRAHAGRRQAARQLHPRSRTPRSPGSATRSARAG